MVFIPPIASQRGISSEGIGIIYTINPLVSASFNVLVGFFSDRLKIHRLMLVITSILVAVSYTAYFFIPSVQLPSPANISIPAQSLCEESFLLINLCPNTTTQEGHVNKSNTQCDNLEKEIFGGHCHFECKTSLSIESNMNRILNITIKENKLLEKRYICQEEECFIAKTVNLTDPKFTHEELSCKETNFLLNCKGRCRDQDSAENILYLLSTKEFWLSALCIITLFMTFESSNSLTDAMCFIALGERSHKYGNTRLFGTLAWGLVGGAMGLLVNIASKGQQEMNYTPAMVICSFLLFFNVIFTMRIDVEVPGRQESSSIRKVLFSFRCISFLVTVLIMGITMGIIWTFEFIYIKDVALQWDPHFSNLNLIFGLIVIIDCLLGETPSLLLSGYIIKKLTNVHTFSLSMAVASAKLLMYGFISNPWVFLPVHLTHGVAVGVFFANMITYSYVLAPEGAQATMQSVASGCFTLGRASGALLGGILIEKVGGSLTFIIMGGVLSVYTALYTTVNCTIYKCSKMPNKGVNHDRCETPNDTEKNEEAKLTSDNASGHDLDAIEEKNENHQKE